MKYIITIVLLAGIMYGGYYLTSGKTPSEDSINSNENNQATELTTETVVGTTTINSESKKTGFSLADISSHKDASSCWSAINGKVYDLTAWIGMHPGGEKGILSLCGKDGTTDFMKKHGTSEEAKAQLPKFVIGDLVTE